MARDIVILGAGGHAKVVIELFRAMGGWRILGLLDSGRAAQTVLGLPVIGDDGDLPRLRRDGVTAAFVAIGGNALRERLGAALLSQGFEMPAAVHPAASVSPSARIGAGVAIMAGASIAAETTLRDLSIVNHGALVDHDTLIGVAAHVAPGCAMAGSVQVGDRALVGVGSAVRPGIRIGADSVIGAGSAVVADVPEGAIVGGTPARPLRAAVAR
jgi:UDP-perosamine 4-acetyltransferase